MPRLPLVAALLAAFTSLPAVAHIEKITDRNGGHWDDFGNYHCHEARCQLTDNRYDFRRRQLSVSRRFMEDYYLEEDWPHWEILGGGCQDARTQTLVLTSKRQVTFSTPRQCKIREGVWVDEYTGEEYTRGARLEVDHIIHPMYANASNGYAWDAAKRRQFANDPLNLIPVSRDADRKRRDREIGRWLPREEFRCEYAASWQAVAEKYDLDLFARDRSRINGILKDCDQAQDGDVSEQP